LAEKNNWVLRGKIVSGVKEGAFFTQLDWVQEQCEEKLGFRPYPGTLNLEVLSECLPIIEAMQELEGIALSSPDPVYCSGKTLPIMIEGISGAIIIPAEDLRVHGKSIVEIIAPLGLRDRLNLKDGDAVTVLVDP
jgi:CTP-dependent riboflavin kinase